MLRGGNLMYAIIRQGNGKYYTSTVFGYFHDIKSTDDYQRYLERIHSPYYIVWNEAKTNLTKVFAMQPNTKYLIPQVLIVDANKENWIEDGETNMGCVNFLTRDTADRLTVSQEMPLDIFQKCMSLEKSFSYDNCQEVKTETDIENLDCVSGGFHDAYIQSCALQDNGVLHVHFNGTWGCEIDVWFWGDVSYCIESRNPDIWDPYWSTSSIFFENGYIYLVDESDMSAKQINDNHCWFKAKHMKYQVIPD